MKDYNAKPITEPMAKKPKKKRPNPNVSRGDPQGTRVFVIIVIPAMIAIVGGALFVLNMAMSAHSDPEARAAISTGTRTPFQPATETPHATETHAPDPTMAPTETSTREPTEAAPVVVQVVEPSPYPTHTPYPTYTAEPTEAATRTPEPTEKSALDKKLESSVAIQIRRNELRMDVIEFLLSPGMLFMYALMVVLAMVWIIMRRLEKERRACSGSQSAQEIHQGRKPPERTPPPVEPVYPDIIEILERSIVRYGENGRSLVGWRYLKQLDATWTGPRWDKALKRMDEVGLTTIRQSGVGTYLSKTNLRGARIYIIKALHPLPTTPPPRGGDVVSV